MRRSRGAPRTLPTCGSCLHFENDPAALERNFIGIAALSSAFGSTRGEAGICRKKSTFQDPEAGCPAFEPRIEDTPS